MGIALEQQNAQLAPFLMLSRFIDQFDVILLDMARTFMFNIDRFFGEEDFAATYRQIGGETLSDDDVRQIIRSLFSAISRDYQDPRFMSRFPPVRQYLQALSSAQSLPSHELDLLEWVFALHEVGEIPPSHAQALRKLRQTHRLGVVSDIWSRKDLFLQEFERAGVLELFDAIVFSSDHGCIKPSFQLFRQALSAFTAEHEHIVFVGDNWQRDIVGAKSEMLSAIWINPDNQTIRNDRYKPDLIVHSLLDIL